MNHVRHSKPPKPRLSRSAFSSAMSRPAAEEQFLERNPWANPQHPSHQQQHIGRLSRQVSDQTQVADATITPTTQKSLIDLNKPAGSASTIPEHLSAQVSSALATPYSNGEGLRNATPAVTANGTDQQPPPDLEQKHQQKERLQSLSPTEKRKHNLFVYGAGRDKANSLGNAVSAEVASQPYKSSQLALFDSPSQPDSLPRHAQSNTEMDVRHATSSPITLHRLARQNSLTSTPGLSRIGAR